MAEGNNTKSTTNIEDENLKLIIKHLNNITYNLKTEMKGIVIFYKIITIISLISPKILSYMNLIPSNPSLDIILAISAIVGLMLLIMNIFNIFWKMPEYLIAKSSLACMKLFSLLDRFWKYCNKNWLIGFLTSFLRLPSFVFATILYHAMLLMEKIKSLPAIIKSIPSKIILVFIVGIGM